MVLVGHSAGGQLALWAAGRSRLRPEQALYSTDPFIPRTVIGLAAITDLAAYAAGHNDCQAVTPRLVGGGPSDHPERYAQASPAELGVAIPAVLLQGDQDAIVPPSQAKSLPGARVRLIRGAGHFDLIHPSTAAFDILLTELENVMNP
jgi:pimeloyl-ACP methyl ester carboxylesterase